jgi:acetyltransferase-like isoleucine patch superfamily enzyme
MKKLSSLAVVLYGVLVRAQSKCFSLLVSGAFARFGSKSVISIPVRILGQERISIGNNVFVGQGSWLQVVPGSDGSSPAILLGNGVSIAGMCVISAVTRVSLEDHVLLARNVYISDHFHRYRDIGVPVMHQGVDKVQPVLIREGAWLGQNVVVCPGVTIGKGAVVGANSVVTTSIPDYCVAVGAPAKVIRAIEQPALDMSGN